MSASIYPKPVRLLMKEEMVSAFSCSLLAGVQLFEYELSLKLQPVNTAVSA